MLQLQTHYQPHKMQPNLQMNLLRANPESQLTKLDRGDNNDSRISSHEVHSWKEIELESYGDYLDMQS